MSTKIHLRGAKALKNFACGAKAHQNLRQTPDRALAKLLIYVVHIYVPTIFSFVVSNSRKLVVRVLSLSFYLHTPHL